MKFLSFLLFLVFSLISSEFWKCGKDGKFFCKQNQTCCETTKSNKGFACFNVENGICCKDGESACPQKTKCTEKNTCQSSNKLK